jgi:thioredoxin 1
MAIEITDNNFQQLVVDSGKPAMLDFWAEWCGPCRMIAPIVEELAEEYGENIVIGKVDVDNNPEITARYGIRSIPTLLYFKNGEVVDKQLGAVPRNSIEEKLRSLL